MIWLRASPGAVTLHTVHRTKREGLLDSAAALRSGRPVRSVLAEHRSTTGKSGPAKTWLEGEGIKIQEVPAKQPGLVAWFVANELRGVGGRAVVITPDGRSPFVRAVLKAVSERT